MYKNMIEKNGIFFDFENPTLLSEEFFPLSGCPRSQDKKRGKFKKVQIFFFQYPYYRFQMILFIYLPRWIPSPRTPAPCPVKITDAILLAEKFLPA